MPKGDFLIGVEAGSQLVGDVIGDRQRADAADLAKRQALVGNAQAESEMTIRRRMLEEQVAHSKKVDEYNAANLDINVKERDLKIESKKQEVIGLTRLSEMNKKLMEMQLKDPQGLDFLKNGTALRSEYSDLFAHPSENVRNGAQAVYNQGDAFLRSTETSALGREITDLIDKNFLNRSERSSVDSIKSARLLRDQSEASDMFSKAGLKPTDVFSAGLPTPEIGPSGGWTPSYKYLVAKQIATVAEAKVKQASPPTGTVTLKVPMAKVADAGPSDWKSLGGGTKVDNAIEITVPISEVLRSPFLRQFANQVAGNSGVGGVFGGGKEYIVRNPATGEQGTMSEADYELNILRGNKLQILGNTK